VAEYIDFSILGYIFKINFINVFLLYAIAYLYFVLLPRWLFPQKYAGAGLEKVISNILYILAFSELVVPLMVFLKIFNIFTFLLVIFLTKLFFVKFYEKKEIKGYFKHLRENFLIGVFDFFDDYKNKIYAFKRDTKSGIKLYFYSINYYMLAKKLLVVMVFVYLVYVIGYRCFISMSNPLPDTSQFFEWVAFLKANVLYSPHKTAGADFYGLSVFVFVLHMLTNIDTIILFNIYPLLLITFLLLGLYFVLKRFTLSSLVALSALLVFGAVLLSSPLNEMVATVITYTSKPEIVEFMGFRFYNFAESFFKTEYLEHINMKPYIRYFSGMAYEMASAFFMINLFYLIKALDRGRVRYFINYSLSLMLVFIFHGGGAIILIFPSMLIAINAILSLKLNWYKLKNGLLAIFIAAIFGNFWVLSILKYGLPQDFGVAAPFLDKIFHTQKSLENLIYSGLEQVVISYVKPLHLAIFFAAAILYLIARFYKKGFYFSSFLLIPIGVMIVYYSQNLGFPKLVHPLRGAEYLFLSLSVLIACFIKFFYLLFVKLLKRKGRYLFLALVYLELFIIVVYIPKFYQQESFKKYVNNLQYSEIPYFLYKIIRSNRAKTWTVVSYVQEYSKVLGKGYMVNVNDFITKYDHGQGLYLCRRYSARVRRDERMVLQMEKRDREEPEKLGGGIQ